MNFDFLAPLGIIRPFYVYCSEAEEFVLSKADISVAASRKSVEYIVRLLYTAAIQNEATQMTVYDMLCTPDFVMYLDDRTLLDAIHFIRKKGNVAVHSGGLSVAEAKEVLEQLHFVAGEVCIFLGLLSDYPPFDPACLEQTKKKNSSAMGVFDEEEPGVADEIIQSFSSRLKGVTHYSQLRRKSTGFIDVHVNTSEYDELEKAKGKEARINTSNNVRTAFSILSDWAAKLLPDAVVRCDYSNLQFTVARGAKEICFAVKMGCSNLGSRTPDGQWQILQGIDYILYVPDIDPARPVVEQFRLFTREQFLQMWKDLKLVRVKISTQAHKRIRELLGDDVEFEAEKYADVMAVQSFKNSRKKTLELNEYLETVPKLDAMLVRDILT